MSFAKFGTGASSADGTESLCQLIDLAEAMGIVVVCAAGNFGPSNSGIREPAAATRAISVAAADDQGTVDCSDDAIWSGSSRGPRASDSDQDSVDEPKPEVTAPGVNIYAARYNTTTNGAIRTGTSMAAPHVAGLAALIMEKYPGINPASVKDLIIATADAMGSASQPSIDPIWNDRWGWGMVNAYEALNATLTTDLTYPGHPPTHNWNSPDITVSPDPPQKGNATTVTVDIVNIGVSDAMNARIHFGVHVFSASIPTFHDIGTEVVDIPAGTTNTVSIVWTPAQAGHQCLKVEIGYGFDTDFTNNKAQRNLGVAASPVTFQIQNTLDANSQLIEFFHTFENPGAGWNVNITPPSVTLSGEDCPVPVDVLLIAPTGAPPGQVQIVHVAAKVGGPGGIELGGVSVKDTAPTTSTSTSTSTTTTSTTSTSTTTTTSSTTSTTLAPPVIINIATDVTLWAVYQPIGSIMPMYSTNLETEPIEWLSIAAYTNTAVNGTNRFDFAPPDTNVSALYFHLRQDPNPPHPKIGQTAELITHFHGVSGTAIIVDEDTIVITNFFFDGTGVDVRAIVSPNGGFAPYTAISDDLLNPQGYVNETLDLTIPPGTSLDDISYISIWCVPVSISCGDGQFQ